jgi:hypothetical protein
MNEELIEFTSTMDSTLGKALLLKGPMYKLGLPSLENENKNT